MINALMVGLGYRESQKQLSNRDLFGDPNSVCDRFKKGLTKLEFKSIVDDLNAKIDANADQGKSEDLIAHYYLDMLKVSGLARDPEYRPLNELSSDLKKLAKKNIR